MTPKEIINRISTLSTSSNQKLALLFREEAFQKNEILLQANKLEKDMYFIKSGLVRAFTQYKDQDITFWFGTEGAPILPMNSYVYNKKNYEYIELLEDSILYKVSIETLQKLYLENQEIANWGRILAEKELVTTEQRLISRIAMKATDRYLALLSEHPNLLQRASLGHIASFLGITQVSLSRIRAQIK